MKLSLKILLCFFSFLFSNSSCSATDGDSVIYIYKDSSLSDIPDSAIAYFQGKKVAEAKLLGLVEKTLWGGSGARIEVVCYASGRAAGRAIYLVGMGKFGLFEKIRPVGEETKAIFFNWPCEIIFSRTRQDAPIVLTR